MSKKVNGIQIEGLNELMSAFENMPKELGPSVIRNISRKPANRVVSAVRKIFPYKKTGKTKRSFGILKVKDKFQKFLEIGVKGRSLAWIFMSGAYSRKTKKGKETGDINPIGNLLPKAAEMVATQASKEIVVDINKVIGKTFKRYARR